MTEDGTAAVSATYALPKAHIEHIAQLLRSIQVRMTPQRMFVLDALLAQEGHATAEDILRRAAAQYPALNLATVYRVLELFIVKGLVGRTNLGGNAATFELVGESMHHHLVCQQCGAVSEIGDELVLQLRAGLQQATGFVIPPRPLALFGICPACQRVPGPDGDERDDAT